MITADEDHPLAIGRPCGRHRIPCRSIHRLGQADTVAAVRRLNIDQEVVTVFGDAHTSVRDRSSVRGVCGRPHRRHRGANASRRAAIRRDLVNRIVDIDIARLMALCDERYARAIGGPRGRYIGVVAIGNLFRRTTGDRHDEDVRPAVVCKADGLESVLQN